MVLFSFFEMGNIVSALEIFGAKVFKSKGQIFSIPMSHKDTWISVLRRLQPTIKKAHFLTWFQNTALVDVQGGLMKVGVPTAFARDWISNKYDLKILQAAKEIDPGIETIDYEISGRLVEEGNAFAVDVKGMLAQESDKKVRKVRNINEVTVA